jgi:DNA-binding MarR family transcriptional regulator
VEAVRVLAKLARLMEKRSQDLSLAHYRILAAVGAGDQRASRVAQRLALGKPTVSASVEALTRRGLISCRPVENDARASALALTAEGRTVLDKVEAGLVEMLAELCAHVRNGPQILSALVSLGEALDEVADQSVLRHRVARGRAQDSTT